MWVEIELYWIGFPNLYVNLTKKIIEKKRRKKEAFTANRELSKVLIIGEQVDLIFTAFYLELFFDEPLSWGQHIIEISKSVIAKLWVNPKGLCLLPPHLKRKRILTFLLPLSVVGSRKYWKLIRCKVLFSIRKSFPVKGFSTYANVYQLLRSQVWWKTDVFRGAYTHIRFLGSTYPGNCITIFRMLQKAQPCTTWDVQTF